MRKHNRLDWIPTDDLKLEDNALSVAKSDFNSLVIAGPGAGKTELLAQRACYLLQTNECRFPRKILAISFKKDAATNLKDRVTLRCGDELSKRFDSMTFDAFAKGLLERFRSALPEKFKLNRSFDIAVTDLPVLDEYKAQDLTYFNTKQQKYILDFFYAGLPYDEADRESQLRDFVWMKLLAVEPPRLTFKMVMRLAELVIKSNPLIKLYLQKTYQYVFLDEFQDTTSIQYSFLSSCFFNNDTIFTAVGDTKQRIMVWAGAKQSVFEDFKKDTSAKDVHLFMNFRSAPRLVALQNFLVQNLLNKEEAASASSKWQLDDGECNFWVFENTDHEKGYLLQQVKTWLEVEKIQPREICILVKQQLKNYAGDIIEYFNQNGVRARDETEVQNLLTEEVIVLLINFFYSSISTNRVLEKVFVDNFLTALNELDIDEKILEQHRFTSKFQKTLKLSLNKDQLSKEQLNQAVLSVLNFVDVNKLKAGFPTYKDDAHLKFLLESFVTKVHEAYLLSGNMLTALDDVLGKDTIPVMTVHKSKGLEYHTIVFIGLEDGAFWSYKSQPDEDNCTFFVALSRAKQRVCFTFSKIRPDRYNARKAQSLAGISKLVKVLSDSGIANIELIPLHSPSND